MGILFKKYKTRFRYALKPVFAMLVSREKNLDTHSWSMLTHRTFESILRNPAEYLGQDLPDENLMRDILDEIFVEFHKDLKVKKAASNPER